MVKTEPGARAAFEIDSATSLELGGDAAVKILDSRTIALDKGSIVLRQIGSERTDRKGAKVQLGGRTGEVDPRYGADLTARARDDEHAAITVERGRMTLRADNGDTTVVLSGETLELAKGRAPERIASSLSVERTTYIAQDPVVRPEVTLAPARGLGTMTARVPGRTDVVSGVRLTSHHVEVALRDGFARTEVEEVFANDTSQVLEGRYVFPLPTNAGISRLTLWVNDKPVEGEIVEKKRAATIFHSIVEDTVRPRDPALLEWVAGGDFSLKVFPLPAKGSRKVRLAYDQIVPSSAGRLRYVYPFGGGSERATRIDDFSVHVVASDGRAKIDDPEVTGYAAKLRRSSGSIEAEYRGKNVSPTQDFVLSYGRERAADAELSLYTPALGDQKNQPLAGAAIGATGDGYFALRLTADMPANGRSLAHTRRDRVVVVDASHGQSEETLRAGLRLATALVRQLDDDERFAVLACDSGCASYPDSGLAPTGSASSEGLARWTRDRFAHGSSDVAGALMDAAARLDGAAAGQIVYVGDGAPSSGELKADTIAARVRSFVSSRNIDLRLLGSGRSPDTVTLEALAQKLGATYEPVASGGSLDQRAAEIAMALRSPVIAAPRLDLPNAFSDVYPPVLPNLRLGQEVVVVGRFAGTQPGDVRLSGTLGGEPYAITRAVRLTSETSRQNPLVPRLWAQARIGALEASDAPSAVQQTVDASKQYHVMSRYTSLLVLENDAMFHEFGIKRTSAPGSLSDLAAQAPSPAALEPAPTSLAQPQSTPAKAPMEPYSTGASEAKRDKGEAPSTAAADDAYAAPRRKAARSATEGESLAQDSYAAPPPAAAPVPTAAAPRAAPAMEAAKPSMALDMAGGSGLGTLGPSQGAPGYIGRTSGTVVTGAAEVSGRLPPEVVQRIVRQRVGQLRACYERGLSVNPGLRGNVVVAFTITPGGAVASAYEAGGNLPDPSVRQCVVSTFYGMVFPSPEGGSVWVRYPISFAAGAPTTATFYTPYQRPVSTGPTATHRVGDETWTTQGEQDLVRLRNALAQSPESRKRFEELIRGLLVRGRFEEALGAAKRFVSLDPDSSVAQELLSYAAAAADDPRLAVTAVDDQTETDPSSAKWHARAARAFEAMSDERRACAHWRSLYELKPSSEEYAYESLRCRARVFGDRDSVVDARRFDKPGKLLGALASALESRTPPAYDKSVASAGQLEAEIACIGADRCPSVLVVAPNGTILSPFTPTDARSGPRSVAIGTVREGTYRTLVVGGDRDARGNVTVRALGSTRKYAIVRGGRQTVAATTIQRPRAMPYELVY
jgi:Ca-activated chloride channel family protein